MHEKDSKVKAALARIDARIERECQSNEFPGLSVAVVHDQETIWTRSFGYADVEREIPTSPQTVFKIGSVTKLFTATMLMQLRDAGKLQLDDPIEKYLPAFKVKSRFSDPRPPTFRQVAAHVSGLPAEAPLDYFMTSKFPTIKEILESLKNTEMVAPPLAKFQYSNLGYAIMGHALELIANQAYTQYITENILQPLGMHSSGFNPTPEMASRLATGYIAIKGRPPEIAPQWDLAAFIPCGGMYSTVEDMAHFISLQFREGPAGGAQILGGTTLREMRSPVFIYPDWQGGRAIGWALRRMYGHTVICHDGAQPGFHAAVIAIPDLKLGVTVMVNANTTSPVIYHICSLTLEPLIGLVSPPQ